MVLRKKAEKSAIFGVWGKVLEETALVVEIPEFPYSAVWGKARVASVPNISSIHSSVSIEHQLVTDRH